MFKPSEKELNMYDLILNWRYFDSDGDCFRLKKEAPEDVKRAYETLRTKYGYTKFAPLECIQALT